MRITAVDLFCGAGGTSTGLVHACDAVGAELDLLAVNHWPVAIDTHARNHPAAQHLCVHVEVVDPRRAVPGGRVDLLIASPECTHHSVARGGRPVSDQQRASAWHVLRWVETLRVDNVLLENVPEFQTWGPIGASGRPLKSKRGETYKAFLAALGSLGYRVDARVLNAADYGDLTTRKRLFILARRGNRRPVWPAPTHGRDGDDLFGARRRWRPAHDIIDWSIPGTSIFRRKRPLAPATLRRIAAGLRKFGGPALEPFLVALRNHSVGRSLDEPAPTVTTSGAHFALCEPFVIPQHSGGAPRSVKAPLPTVATAGAISVVRPFLVPFYGERQGQEPRTHAVDEPVPVIPASGSGKFGLVEPYLVKFNGTGGAQPLDQPLDTVTTKDRFGLVTSSGDTYALDIHFRMLESHELAAAQGFDREYEFAGTRADRIRQIGNAVPVNTAEALCAAVLQSCASRPRRASAAQELVA